MKRTLVTSWAVVGLCVAALPARGIDLTAFAALGSPSETWSRGYGASVGSRWFGLVTFEGEAMKLPVEGSTPGAPSDGSVTAFTAAAFISPPLDLVVPYGGIGVGLFRQTLGTAADTGRLSALILGVRVKFGPAFARAEFRDYALSGEPLLPLDRRYSLGLGITF